MTLLLDTYANLQASILNWMVRSDLSTDVAGFISLVETDMRDRIKNRRQEIRATLTATPGVATVALPADYGRWRSIYVVGAPRTPLTYKTPSELDAYGQTDTLGKPHEFTIEGSNLRFKPIPDSAYSISLLYFQDLPSLSDSNTTNWMLTRWANNYLFGAMAYGYMFIKDMETANNYKAVYETGMNQMFAFSDAEEYAGPLEMKYGFPAI